VRSENALSQIGARLLDDSPRRTRRIRVARFFAGFRLVFRFFAAFLRVVFFFAFFLALPAAFFFAFVARLVVALFFVAFFFALARFRAGFLEGAFGFFSSAAGAGSGVDQIRRSESASGDGLTGGVSGIGSHIPGPPIPVPLASCVAIEIPSDYRRWLV
jgi:hypothetical protein